MTHRSSAEQGSVLLWIMVAVALLAGLTAAMNQGSRTSTGMVTGQEARLYASEIIQYGNSVKQAVQRMNMGGISEGDFSFENAVFKNQGGALLHEATSYPNCTDNKCKVFHAEGGGLQAAYTPTGSAENTESPNNSSAIKAGAWEPYAASLDGIGTDERDMIFMTGYIKKDVCTAINTLLGVNNPNGAPPSFSYASAATQYAGANPYGSSANGWSGGTVTGHESYCYEIAGRPGVYNYLVTLIAR